MTASEAKNKLTFYYMTSGTFISVVTEIKVCNGYVADLPVLNKDFVSTEVEIKTSLEDLRGELRAIQKWKGLLSLDYPVSKGSKHKYYLNKTFLDTNKFFVPNKFYFAVTENLLEEAKKELEGTPYGLIYLPEAIGANLDPRIVIRGKKIHDVPVDKQFLSGNLRRMSWENYYLRKNVEEKQVIINHYKNEGNHTSDS